VRALRRLLRIPLPDAEEQLPEPSLFGPRLELVVEGELVEVETLQVPGHRAADDAEAGARVVGVPSPHLPLGRALLLVVLPLRERALAAILFRRHDGQARLEGLEGGGADL